MKDLCNVVYKVLSPKHFIWMPVTSDSVTLAYGDLVFKAQWVSLEGGEMLDACFEDEIYLAIVHNAYFIAYIPGSITSKTKYYTQA